VIAVIVLLLVAGTENVDDTSTGDNDNSVGSFGTRPHYYDSLDDSTEKPSVPSVASGFVKMRTSSSDTAVYNSFAKKLMVWHAGLF